ncbi:hypothetical protein [uncultured Umboniibacter sp.]|uniref:hypothetical protein n=1 Tax=uncultured Umboniibacter sp. TaxID=1798917 RepID=UPI00262718E9|nr:hypothetical protein [uncultured Umboniibacter sp.]
MLNIIYINSGQSLMLGLLIVEHYRQQSEEALLAIAEGARPFVEETGFIYQKDFFLLEDIKSFHGESINIVVRQHPSTIGQISLILDEIDLGNIQVSSYEDSFAIGYLEPHTFSRLLRKYKIEARHSLSFDRLHLLDIPEKIEGQLVSSENLHHIRNSYPVLFHEAQKVMELFDRLQIKELTLVAMRPIGSDKFHRGRYKSSKPTRTLVRIVNDLIPYCDTQDIVVYRQDKRDRVLTRGAIKHLIAGRPHLALNLDDHLSGAFGLDAILYLLAMSDIKLSVICFNTSFPLSYSRIGSNNQYIVGIDIDRIEHYDLVASAEPSLMEVYDRMMRYIEVQENPSFSVDQLSHGLFRIRR